jgi:DNA-binding CsgD family transcriptional regulator/tetratricopeptide (TPR) repeat protein
MHPVSPAGVLAGRADELALLDGLVRDLARGSGAAVLIEGEPGIGKTALVRAALAAVPAGSCQVFWGAGDELGQELPLLPFLDALGVRGPSGNARRATIAGLLRGEVATDRGADVPAILAEQLIALTIDETAARPVVLIIDDLQWADPASVKLWGRLARTARDVPLLLAGMVRPVPQRDDLLALRRGVDELVRLQLTALSQPAVAQLVTSLAGGLPESGLLRLAHGAGGNPLYLTELIAALSRSGGITVTPSGAAELAAASVPGSLPAAIADRIGFVSAPTRDVLRAAALLGVEFAVSDLTTVLGKTVAALVPALDEARAAGVLIDAGNSGGLAFRHPLIREALYAELPAAVRGVWHRDAGYALAGAGAPPDRVARQLLHAIGDAVRASGPPVEIERPPVAAGATWPAAATPMDQWMLDWLTGSADSLVGQAPGVAAELLARAVAGLPTGSDRRGWLASRLADALYRTGDREEAERVAERALGYANDPDLVVDLHWTLAQCRMLAGAGRESFAVLDRALAAPGITPKHRGRLLVLAARTYLYIGDVEASGREADSALTAATESDDHWTTGWALHVLALSAVSRGDLTEALPLYDRALAVTETDPALYDLGLLLQLNKAVMLFILDRPEEGLATAERARQLAEQVGTAHRLAQAHFVLGEALYEIGRWDDALTEIAAVPQDLKEPTAACYELGITAKILFHRNQAATARRYLADAQPHAERAGQHLVPPLALARSLEREAAGAPGEALGLLTPVISDNPDDLGQIEDLFPDAVRLAVKTADKVTAQALADLAATLAEGSQIPHRLATALYCQGVVDGDAGALLAAAQRYADAGRPLPRAQALEAAAQVLAEADDRTAARLAFEQAVEVYEFLGAEADLNRVHAEFRAHGIRRGPHSKHRRATSGWDSLTGTELKVAAFVADGLSNPEIAARLMLSRRTVATHVSHILKKLGVTTRTDIARESALRARAGAR